MTTQSATVSVRDRWFAGTFLRILADSTDTDGSLTVLEQRAHRDFSPPTHIHHNEDTAIIVLDGELTLSIGGVESAVASGGFVWLPRDVAHTFRVDSDEAHFLELALPGGVEGFHIDASTPALEPNIPDDPSVDVSRLASAAGPYSIDLVGPPLGR